MASGSQRPQNLGSDESSAPKRQKMDNLEGSDETDVGQGEKQENIEKTENFSYFGGILEVKTSLTEMAPAKQLEDQEPFLPANVLSLIFSKIPEKHRLTEVQFVSRRWHHIMNTSSECWPEKRFKLDRQLTTSRRDEYEYMLQYLTRYGQFLSKLTISLNNRIKRENAIKLFSKLSDLLNEESVKFYCLKCLSISNLRLDRRPWDDRRTEMVDLYIRMLEKNIPKELEKLHMHDLLLSPKDAVRLIEALTNRFSDLQELDIEELVSTKQPEWADVTRTIDVDQPLENIIRLSPDELIVVNSVGIEEIAEETEGHAVVDPDFVESLAELDRRLEMQANPDLSELLQNPDLSELLAITINNDAGSEIPEETDETSEIPEETDETSETEENDENNNEIESHFEPHPTISELLPLHNAAELAEIERNTKIREITHYKEVKIPQAIGTLLMKSKQLKKLIVNYNYLSKPLFETLLNTKIKNNFGANLSDFHIRIDRTKNRIEGDSNAYNSLISSGHPNPPEIKQFSDISKKFPNIRFSLSFEKEMRYQKHIKILGRENEDLNFRLHRLELRGDTFTDTNGSEPSISQTLIKIVPKFSHSLSKLVIDWYSPLEYLNDEIFKVVKTCKNLTVLRIKSFLEFDVVCQLLNLVRFCEDLDHEQMSEFEDFPDCVPIDMDNLPKKLKSLKIVRYCFHDNEYPDTDEDQDWAEWREHNHIENEYTIAVERLKERGDFHYERMVAY